MVRGWTLRGRYSCVCSATPDAKASDDRADTRRHAPVARPHRFGGRIEAYFTWLIAIPCLAAFVLAWAGATPAEAATPSQTDVMFVFDTSGSMAPELDEAKLEIEQVMSQIDLALPNVDFGVSEVRLLTVVVYIRL